MLRHLRVVAALRSTRFSPHDATQLVAGDLGKIMPRARHGQAGRGNLSRNALLRWGRVRGPVDEIEEALLGQTPV